MSCFNRSLVLSFGELEINHSVRKVYCNQQEIELTVKKYNILYLLAVNNENVWSDNSLGNERKAVGYHILNIRRKLNNAIPNCHFVIENVREVGYCFEVHSDK